MGLFGPSKREKQLQQENERLQALLLPEQRNIEKLQHDIATLNSEIENRNIQIQNINSKIEKLNREALKIEGQISNKKNEKQRVISGLDNEIETRKKQISVYDSDIYVLEYGLYKPSFEFANSDMYKDQLAKLRDLQKEYIKSDRAAFGNTNWQVNGSTSQGRTMVNNYKKLLLRAFNVECDDIVANVKISNLDRSIERIEKISEQISKLGKIMGIGISSDYIRFKSTRLN